MNIAQRIILGLISIAALLMLLYPPFYVRLRAGESNLGYHFLFDPPSFGEAVGFVHAPTLLMEFLGLLIIGGALWMLAGTLPWYRAQQPENAAPNKSIRKTGGLSPEYFDPTRIQNVSQRTEGDKKR